VLITQHCSDRRKSADRASTPRRERKVAGERVGQRKTNLIQNIKIVGGKLGGGLFSGATPHGLLRLELDKKETDQAASGMEKVPYEKGSPPLSPWQKNGRGEYDPRKKKKRGMGFELFSFQLNKETSALNGRKERKTLKIREY